MTTPKAHPFKQTLWLDVLVLFSSLPQQTERVKLVTSCRGLRDYHSSFSHFVKGLAWDEVGKALEHLGDLSLLEIAALDHYHQPTPFAGHPEAQEGVLDKLPLRLRRIASFL